MRGARGIGGAVVTIIAWFAILFTGRHPEGMSYIPPLPAN